MAVITWVTEMMRRVAVVSVALGLIGMSAEALTEQAAQTEAAAPSMGLIEIEIAALAENSAVVAGLTGAAETAALPTETLLQPEATEPLVEY